MLQIKLIGEESMNLLEQARDKFTKWRDCRSKVNEKFPEELLELACECTYKYGKTIVIKELGIGSYRLADAMLVYPSNSFQESQTEPTIKKENIATEEVEFQEISITKINDEFSIKDKVVHENIRGPNPVKEQIFSFDKIQEQEILFELESKLGFRIKIFSKLESVHRNLISCFLDVRN